MENNFEKPQQPDPSKSQFLDQALDLEPQEIEERFLMQKNGRPVHLEIYVDKKTGEKFIKIKKAPRLQMFISLLAKGAINTSDVIKKGGEYFSHEQNAKTVESLGEEYYPEMEADLFILEKVFQDRDHIYYPVGHPKRNDTSKNLGVIPENTFKEHANILADDVNKKVNYFDFTNALWDPYSSPGGKMYEESQFKRDLEWITNIKVLEILKRKSRFFLDHIFSDDLEAFTAIVKKSKVDFEGTEKELREIFAFMQKRLQSIYNISSEKLNEDHPLSSSE